MRKNRVNQRRCLHKTYLHYFHGFCTGFSWKFHRNCGFFQWYLSESNIILFASPSFRFVFIRRRWYASKAHFVQSVSSFGSHVVWQQVYTHSPHRARNRTDNDTHSARYTQTTTTIRAAATDDGDSDEWIFCSAFAYWFLVNNSLLPLFWASLTGAVDGQELAELIYV